MNDNINIDRLVEVARDMLSKDGEKPEHDRAVVQMVTYLQRFPVDYTYKIAVLLGVSGRSLRELEADGSEPDDDEPEPEPCASIVVSDDFSNHNLPVGAAVTPCPPPSWAAFGDNGNWYTQGGVGDEVAIDPRDLTPATDDDADDDEHAPCSWQEQAPGCRPKWARVACSGEITHVGLGGVPLCAVHVAARAAEQARQRSKIIVPGATGSTEPVRAESFRTDEDGQYALSDCRWWGVIPAHRPGVKDCAGRMGRVTRRGGTVVTECETHFNVRNGWPA